MTSKIRLLAIATLAIGLLMAFIAGAAYYLHIHAYDGIIASVGQEYEVDAGLIRAVIWRESRFNRRRVGKHDEIGLMQVTASAAREWAAAKRVSDPSRRELFDPEINIRAGTWYLWRAIQYWSAKPKNAPLPYALAEYNAGRSNALRWAANDQDDAEVFCNQITYPSTRRYVQDILRNYRHSR